MAASSNKNKIPLLVVAGPTATGKSALAVSLAQALGGEVISADSMQIYKHLDIGTAKPTLDERGGVAHHLIDIVEPDVVYSVADYHRDATAAIADVHGRGKTPILCGGTGFYISTFVSGFRFGEQTARPDLRARLNEEFDEDAEKMYTRLRELDAEYAKKIHVNDKKRIVRALEMHAAAGLTPTMQAKNAAATENPYVPFVVVLDCAERKQLYSRIERRADDMTRRGLLEEARYVYDNRGAFKTAAQAIGYKELFPYFAGRSGLDDCVAQLKQATRRYAKRQCTWFKREHAALRLDIGEISFERLFETVKKEWNNASFFASIESE